MKREKGSSGLVFRFLAKHENKQQMIKQIEVQIRADIQADSPILDLGTRSPGHVVLGLLCQRR